jgi:hypothetical protein
MKRSLGRCLLAGILGLAGATVTLAQEGQTPGGYLFFARRNRPTPTTWTRVVEPAAAKSSKRQAACCKTAEDIQTPQPPAGLSAENAPESQDPAVRQVTWGTEFGLGYGWPEEGYYPGTPSYGFGKSYAYPLHGYRATYDWAGQTYSMHCYCAKGYCPHHCPGYRGECYVPCWNDAGTPIIERRCGRGSCFDAFWHMGGYECPRRKTDCPYICAGPPAYYSYGFPRGTPGDPNFVHPRGTGTTPSWPASHDPYRPTPATKPLPAPANPPAPPTPALNPAEAPMPQSQP